MVKQDEQSQEVTDTQEQQTQPTKEVSAEELKAENAKLQAQLAAKEERLQEAVSRAHISKSELNKYKQAEEQVKMASVAKEDLTAQVFDLKQQLQVFHDREQARHQTFIDSLSDEYRTYAKELEDAGIKNADKLRSLVTSAQERGLLDPKKVVKVDATNPSAKREIKTSINTQPEKKPEAANNDPYGLQKQQQATQAFKRIVKH